ncbi:hypothetical protein PRLR6025_22810 [Prevotella lacticifex]|jgi:predicted nucleotidyltransferase|uniref:nucleotidyltransferase family protein n=1 Tax=Prevotella lacticifex TaxID=2854755 RepID=UPI001CC679C0|nr:nucleotidyltransferase domain-containing protein [Prevotella lacticifex]GJG68812.1 hypothetical protein PRLR6025_22810 [Prevotella lacticifex]
MQYGLKQQYIDELRAILRDIPGIEEAVLYGSRARGDYGRGSDIDICLKGEQITPSDVVSLKTALYESRIPYFFDVCVWNNIKNEDFKNNIIRDGKVIFEA